ncbi:MAG: polysaccharide pyruvyl transferase family protein [Dysgonomonas sp.]
MKIGILTFHCAHNYGAVLQAYALQEFLKSHQFETYVIDYRPKELTGPFKVFKFSYWMSKKPAECIQRLLHEPFNLPLRIQRHGGFRSFIKKRLSLKKIDLTSDQTDIDVFIVGSDQIWTSGIFNGLNPVYFTAFNAAKNKKNIAYAASMGEGSLYPIECYLFSKYLKNFSSISVRESMLQDLLQPLTEKKIHQVLDPTLLVHPQVFDKIAIKPQIAQPYILVYQISSDDKTRQIAEDLAKQENGIVIEIKAWVRKDNHTDVLVATPEEFIGYFKYAHCVVTTSFHGTAFSVIYEKPFYVVNSSKQKPASQNRMRSLLSAIDLNSRYISEDARPEFTEINYSKVKTELSALKENSKSFLLQALN